MLSLSLPAVSVGWGLNNVPVAEQGGSWQAFLVSQSKEVLAAWKGASVPDVGGEGVGRQGPHVPLVEKGRGEGRHGGAHSHVVFFAGGRHNGV
jgi:hypothetical protein